ncbi:diguanylate cyclase [Thiocapsa imhoffii]|uniref:Diguanylate cyclase n=1 Tax=Thiocapsa imhoffii TaxID=382777 RepID=A0A9X0WL73_9GAMM|nr:EAL domain-containing protein [Thiocapsa imhoffii]MBK1646633.1 diguanylate cyclase [Thiocapsa imhoffii]
MEPTRPHFEQIVARASDAILTLDQEGLIRYVNPAALHLFARASEELIGYPFGFVVTDGPTEITITRPGGKVVSADVRAVEMDMEGAWVTVLYLRDVTERKASERVLLKTKSQLEEAQRITALGYWEWLPECGSLFWSAMVYEILGVDGHQVVPSERVYEQLVHPDDRAMMLAAKERSLISSAVDLDHRIIRPNGELGWVRLVARMQPDEDGHGQRLLGTIQDITERKLAETQLRDRERLIQMAADLARIGGWEVRLDSQYVIWSDEVCRIHEEPPGMRFTVEQAIAYYAPEWRERITRLFMACAHDGVGYDEEMEIITAKQRRVWIRTTAQAVHNEAGRIISVQGALQDITERKQAEERLRLTAAVFENTSEGILITDTAPVILSVNRAFTEINGYPPEDVLGQNPSLLKSGRHDTDFYRKMWQALNERGHWRGEIWNRRKDGETYPQWVNINAVKSEIGLTTHYIGVFSDISDIKRSEAQLERLAHLDPLTELPNRLLFRTRLEQSLLRAKTTGTEVGMLLVDIDGFRHINDSLGHAVGDLALREIAARLTRPARPEETVARLSGDEFALMIESNEDIETHAALTAERILETLNSALTLAGHELFIGASIGIACAPVDGTEAAELFQNSDAALYQARESGGNTYRHYARALTERAHERVRLTAELHRALDRDELVLYYQPQVDLRLDRLVGFEALLRWQHPERGLLMPDAFLPIAEEAGLMILLGEWVLQRACLQARAWERARLDVGQIAINVSGVQIQRSDFAATVTRVLRETGLAAERIELELTETFVMDLRDRAPQLLGALRDLGISLAMDDFGTGYSSLAYLKGLPFDRLKIDRSFISGLPGDPASVAIVTAITTLCTTLGFKVLAEGVETPAQRQFLLDVGCDLAQGYLFSRAVPAAAVPRLCKRLHRGLTRSD